MCVNLKQVGLICSSLYLWNISHPGFYLSTTQLYNSQNLSEGLFEKIPPLQPFSLE